jgi:hypothetical protein
LPGYNIKVTYEYPVTAPNARDAFETLPVVIRTRLPMLITAGTCEIFDASTGELALKAELNPEKGGIRIKK